MKSTGIISFGVKCPIIRRGDDLKGIVVSSVLESLHEMNLPIDDGDIIGITESVVARNQGNYVTLDDIVRFLEELGIKRKIVLFNPIMSRNRFSLILRGISRYADYITIANTGTYDEQGNPEVGINPYTGIDISEYYREICREENCTLEFHHSLVLDFEPDTSYINASCHPNQTPGTISLADILNRPLKHLDETLSGYNTEFGLLGSNKADENTLKLFPRRKEAMELVESIQDYFQDNYGKKVHVLVYGDGCFKSPGVPSIWEFADPVTCPAYTKELEGIVPNEIKIKAFADDKYRNLDGVELSLAIKEEIRKKDSNLVGSMASQGTTPRNLLDILASTFDLISGSGDQGCPVVYMKNRFKNYSDD